MPEQTIDVNAIIGTYGLAVALVIIGALFVIFKVWPWFVEDQRRRREAEQARHNDYINTYRNVQDLEEQFARWTGWPHSGDDSEAR